MNKTSQIILGLIFVIAGIAVMIRSRSPEPAPDPLAPVQTLPTTRTAADQRDMVRIPGGTFTMGANDGERHEAPPHQVTVKPFWMDRHEVTVADFRRFVDATNYQTEAERIGWSIFFKGTDPIPVEGATWRRRTAPMAPPPVTTNPSFRSRGMTPSPTPSGPASAFPPKPSSNSPRAAACPNAPYAWGHDLRPEGKPVANFFQGSFPNHDTGEDGHKGLAPVAQFPPNPYGLHDISGNAWEWCSDWYDPAYYANSPKHDPRPRNRRRARPCAADPTSAPKLSAPTTASPAAATPPPTPASITSASVASWM